MNQLLALREFATDHFNLDPDRITALAGAGQILSLRKPELTGN